MKETVKSPHNQRFLDLKNSSEKKKKKETEKWKIDSERKPERGRGISPAQIIVTSQEKPRRKRDRCQNSASPKKKLRS